MNEGELYVRIAPHEERVFSLSRLFGALIRLHPQEAFHNNYTQRDVMQAVRVKLRRFRDLDASIRNIQSFSLGGAELGHRLRHPGPDLNELSRLAEELRGRAESLGLVDAVTTLELDRPELQARIDRARAADLGVDTAADRRRAAIDGRWRREVTRFRDAEVNDDYDVQLRLAPEDRGDPDDDLAPLCAADRRRSGAPRQPRAARAGRESVADRPARSTTPGRSCALASLRATRRRTASLRCGRRSRGIGLPPGYTTAVTGRGRELERTGREFAWAFLCR